VNKYRVYFLKEENVISDEVVAASFESITVPSRVASTSVTFYNRVGKAIYLYAHVIKVTYEGAE